MSASPFGAGSLPLSDARVKIRPPSNPLGLLLPTQSIGNNQGETKDVIRDIQEHFLLLRW
jgi:hypothetical protein